MQLKRNALTTLFLILVLIVSAQRNYLEKKVNLSFQDISVRLVFNSISKQTGVVFTYSDFQDQQKVSIQCTERALSLVLQDLSSQINATYRQADKYIIIQPVKKTAEVQLFVMVKGIVTAEDGITPLGGVTLFNRETKYSVLTDAMGNFSFPNREKADPLVITAALQRYEDTTCVIYNPGTVKMVLMLKKKTPAMVSVPNDTSGSRFSLSDSFVKQTLGMLDGIMKSLASKSRNRRNITDTLFSEFNISFLPFISTNYLLNINTVNKVSINILAGISKGVEGVEVGGIANIDEGDVKYVQVSGMVNLVQGNVDGTQVAGILNMNGGNTSAVQVAGMFNVNTGTMNQIQVGGIGNMNGGNVDGVEVGGIINLNRRETNGVQVSGIVNQNFGNMNGVQVGGIYNATDLDVKGVQVAGIANYAKSVSGTQVSGIFNTTSNLHGAQFGFINYSDTCSGIPVGFLSYVNTGYHKLEFAIDEKSIATLGFRTGVEKLHNLFFIGMQSKDIRPVWTCGYGLGTQFPFSRRMSITMDLTNQQLFPVGKVNSGYNGLNKFYVGFLIPFGSKFAVSLGPDANLSVFDMKGSAYRELFNSYPPGPLNTWKSGNYRLSFWVGARLSFRVL